MIKAVLFDLDGVLVEAREWHYKAFNKALKLFGYELNMDEHLDRYDGLPTKVKLNKLTEEKKLPNSLHQFIYSMKQQYTTEMINQYCRPEFQKQIMLKKLKQKNIKLACCSNAIRDTVDLMLRKSGLYDFFDVILSNQDVSKNKPDPEIYLKSLNILGLNPREALIVEDNDYGVRSAQASGAEVIKVQGAEDVNLSLFEGRVDV